MYSYTWDIETGGFLLNSTPLQFSKEPRPVYSKELDILGFDKYWKYDKDDSTPLMWAEANNYIYKGRVVAAMKGGSLDKKPEIKIIEEPEPSGEVLMKVNIKKMVEKNQAILRALVQQTIKQIYNSFVKYRKKGVDVFYVAFSGGKDSVVTLDLVQKALPHNSFKVLFGDTGMEFPDTYETVDFPGFIGSFYNDLKDEALKANPDTITAYRPHAKDTATVVSPGDKDDYSWNIIYDVSDYPAGVKYSTYIGGDNPFTTITNNEKTDGSACVVVKESFGNAFVPFLVDNYQYVYIVDYRYWQGNVGDLVKEKGAKDVIFLNNLSMIRNKYLVGQLQGIIK